VPKVGWEPQSFVSLHRIKAFLLELVRVDLCGKADAAALLAEVKEHASVLSDAFHGGVELATTVAPAGGENVSGEALGVNPYQDRGVRIDIAPGQGEMVRVVGMRAIKVTVKWAVIGREVYGLFMLNQTLGPASIFDNLGNSTGLQPVGFLVGSQVSDASHGPVFMHDFAEYSGCWEVSHADKIDCGFGMPGTAEHSVINCLQWKDVTRLDETIRGGLLIGQQAYGEGAISS